jgi:hypothetical protein
VSSTANIFFCYVGLCFLQQIYFLVCGLLVSSTANINYLYLDFLCLLQQIYSVHYHLSAYVGAFKR